MISVQKRRLYILFRMANSGLLKRWKDTRRGEIGTEIYILLRTREISISWDALHLYRGLDQAGRIYSASAWEFVISGAQEDNRTGIYPDI